MPYSHPTLLVLRDPPPMAIAFAHPALPTCLCADPPRCRGGRIVESYDVRLISYSLQELCTMVYVQYIVHMQRAESGEFGAHVLPNY